MYRESIVIDIVHMLFSSEIEFASSREADHRYFRDQILSSNDIKVTQ